MEIYSSNLKDIDFWLTTFEKYSQKLGVGMKHFMVALLNNLAI
jgi:hypothetical protein